MLFVGFKHTKAQTGVEGIRSAYHRLDGDTAAPALWLGEFIFPYDVARSQTDPRQEVLDFLHTTYASAAALMGWDKELTHVAAPSSNGFVTTTAAEDQA